MTQLRKIYYIPGIISLICIPILLWILSKPAVEKGRETEMDFMIPPKYNPNMTIEEYKTETQSSVVPFVPLKGYNLKKITVKENIDSTTFKEYLTAIKDLQNTKNNQLGIQFTFGENNTYNDIITLLNLLRIADKENFGYGYEPTTDSFYALNYYNPSPDPNDISRSNDTINPDPTYIDYRYYSTFETLKIKYQRTSKELKQVSFAILSGYLLLIISVILNRRLKRI